MTSGRASQLFEEGGSRGYEKEYYSNGRDYYWKNNPEKAITVLQMVICGDMEVMAELVYTKDYCAVSTETAEIEMLKETVGELKTTSDYYQRMFETSRAETIKDFAEKLKEKRGSRGEIWDSDIDNLVKEMVGADNG